MSGHVNFTVTTKILDSDELCGRQKGFVPEKGQSDTLIKPVLVKVSFLQAELHEVETAGTPGVLCVCLAVRLV